MRFFNQELIKFRGCNENSLITPTVSYNFLFVSLVAPHSYSFREIANLNVRPRRLTKSFFKRSYLLATWLHYVEATKPKLTDAAVRMSILPVKRKKYTIIKAPMAHKTRSKEQFEFKFYFFKLSFITFLKKKDTIPNTDHLLFVCLNTKNIFPIFETNLLFLKYYSVKIDGLDRKFFNYLSYINGLKKLPPQVR